MDRGKKIKKETRRKKDKNREGDVTHCGLIRRGGGAVRRSTARAKDEKWCSEKPQFTNIYEP